MLHGQILQSLNFYCLFLLKSSFKIKKRNVNEESIYLIETLKDDIRSSSSSKQRNSKQRVEERIYLNHGNN